MYFILELVGKHHFYIQHFFFFFSLVELKILKELILKNYDFITDLKTCLPIYIFLSSDGDQWAFYLNFEALHLCNSNIFPHTGFYLIGFGL